LVFPTISVPLQTRVLGVHCRQHSSDTRCRSRRSTAGCPSL